MASFLEIIYPRNIPLGARTDEGVPRPNQFGITDFEDLRIPTPDGELLSAFFIRPTNKSIARNVTILMFHGNAGNIGHRVPIAKVLEENIGCNVFMLEYRGYGLSTGTPNEEGIMIDAQTALDYLRQQKETQGGKIIVYGQSIGGACAIQLVAKNQEAGDVVGLILENTFTSMRKLIPSALPPAKYLASLCHQLWPSEDILPRITQIPILFMSGLKDEIVPPAISTEDPPDQGQQPTSATLALRPAPIAPISQPASANSSSNETSAADDGFVNYSGAGQRRTRGRGGGRDRGGHRGRGNRASGSNAVLSTRDTDQSTAHEPESNLRQGGRVAVSRPFGGHLTTSTQLPSTSSSTNSRLQPDAPEFLPGQQHQARNAHQQGYKTTDGNEGLKKATAPRNRRDSSLKSTAPDIATRTHEDISNSLFGLARYAGLSFI
ncbi:MAG: hypothetical protein Q9167_005700 [Letrouitia subvulpina]